MNDLIEVQNNHAAVNAEAQKVAAQVQAQMMIAARFPRVRTQVIDEITAACASVKLAEKASYSFSRAGSSVEGPTIRLAEMIAQCWGHLEFGTKILEQNSKTAVCLAYARDYQKNTSVQKEFTVSLSRTKKTKEGGYLTIPLETPRDISEAIGSQASRFERTCILKLIPADVVEHAIEQCDETLKNKVKITEDTLKKLLEAFEKYGVTRSMIEEKIQRKFESLQPGNYLMLRKIYNSLETGMGVVEDFFRVVVVAEKAEKPDLKSALKGKGKPVESATPPTEPVNTFIAEIEAALEDYPVRQKVDLLVKIKEQYGFDVTKEGPESDDEKTAILYDIQKAVREYQAV
jgi:hypothetical protein